MKFVHCADLHIDSPFRGISNINPALKDILYRSTFDSFNHIVNLAIEEDVDCVLFAGDIYDGADKNFQALHSESESRLIGSQSSHRTTQTVQIMIMVRNQIPHPLAVGSFITPEKATDIANKNVFRKPEKPFVNSFQRPPF